MQDTTTTLTSECRSLGLSNITPASVAAVQQQPYRSAGATNGSPVSISESSPATVAAAAATASAAAAHGDEYAGGKWGRHGGGWYEYEYDNFRTSQSINEWNDEYVRRQFSIFPLRGVSSSRYSPYPAAGGPSAGAGSSVYQPQSYGGINNASYAEQYRPAYYAHASAAEHHQSDEQQSNDGVSRSTNR